MSIASWKKYSTYESYWGLRSWEWMLLQLIFRMKFLSGTSISESSDSLPPVHSAHRLYTTHSLSDKRKNVLMISKTFTAIFSFFTEQWTWAMSMGLIQTQHRYRHSDARWWIESKKHEMKWQKNRHPRCQPQHQNEKSLRIIWHRCYIYHKYSASLCSRMAIAKQTWRAKNVSGQGTYIERGCVRVACVTFRRPNLNKAFFVFHNSLLLRFLPVRRFRCFYVYHSHLYNTHTLTRMSSGMCACARFSFTMSVLRSRREMKRKVRARVC